MPLQIHVVLLVFYGFFLILCGLTAVTFIGKKAKTAVLSGGTSGLLSLLMAYGVSMDIQGARTCGLILSFLLFGVFSWRSTQTLFRLFELIPLQTEEVKTKGIAFLIISLMAVVSLGICAGQAILLWGL